MAKKKQPQNDPNTVEVALGFIPTLPSEYSAFNDAIDPEKEPNEAQKKQLLYMFAKHPWYFFSSGYIRTRDDNDELQPVKLFPAHLEYLQVMVQLWLNYNCLLVAKSRQMFVSYIFDLCYFWEALFRESRTTHLISRKAEDAEYQLQRIRWTYEILPEWLVAILPHVEFRTGDIMVHHRVGDKHTKRPAIEDSVIKALSQDASAPRSRSPSANFADELAHLDPGKCDELLRSAIPSIQKGGRFTGVSTFNGRNEFYRLMYAVKADQIDAMPKIRRFKLRRGMSVFKNERRFYGVELHYTADPKKQVDSDWYKLTRPLLDDESWEQEMELSTSHATHKGMPFFRTFDKRLHVLEMPIKRTDVAAVVRGWDFGFNFPVTLLAFWLGNGLLYFIHEWRGHNEIITKYALRVFAETHKRIVELVSDWPSNTTLGTPGMLYDWGDAEGKQTDSTSATSDIESIYMQYKVVIDPIGGMLAERNATLSKRLSTIIDAKPSMIIHPRCRNLIEALASGYRSREDGRVLKDHFHDHWVDAAACVTTGIDRMMIAPKGFNPWAHNVESDIERGEAVVGGYYFE